MIFLRELKEPTAVPFGGNIVEQKLFYQASAGFKIPRRFLISYLVSVLPYRYMIAYTNLLRCIENLGIAGAYGIRYYGQGEITDDNYIQFIRHFKLGDEYLRQAKNYVPQIGEGKHILI